jgi:hypothetical protein
MDILYRHRQDKSDGKNQTKSYCELTLCFDGININYIGNFNFNYVGYGNRRNILFEHAFTLNILSGDITVFYKINNDNLTDEKMFRDLVHNKKNNFRQLEDLTESGFYNGEKRFRYWGVKYVKATEKIFDLMESILSENFKSDFYKTKQYKEKCVTNPLYDILVDYHLDCKGIKPHDSVYNDIQYSYPKIKWLKKNDFKYLPSVLDEHNIKTKYFISELNKIQESKHFYIRSLNYFCKLFGENYIDYIKKFNWKNHCDSLVPNRKIHVLKNDAEKDFMVKTINNWDKESVSLDSLIFSINKLLTLREFLEENGFKLNFKSKNYDEFQNMMIKWLTIKKHINRGFKIKYCPPKEFIENIESDIIVNGLVFKPKLLLSEEDFTMEGFYMKNCMSNQFAHGAIYSYVSLHHKTKRINLQYRKGDLTQSYGKANSPVESIFGEALIILNERFSKYPEIVWKKEKYDITK